MKTDKIQLKRILIMAGGTGGHIFPGLAIAHCLQAQGVEVHWLGTSQGLESRLVKEEGYPLHVITIGGLRGKGMKTLLTAPWKILLALRQAMQIIKQVRPDAVIGMGGFASGPGGIASWLLGRPLIIHEQNAKAGLTNKILAFFSKKILEGFPSAFKPSAKVITVGNPVRAEIANILAPEKRFAEHHPPLRLLVLGGSLGAQVLNEIVPQVLAQLKANERPEVWHQTGNKHFELAKKQYESMGLTVNLHPFIKDMSQAYAWADIVLCRAGASTVSELCAAGLGAIFVPFPHAVDDHQTANAEFMVRGGAALCIQQRELTEGQLAVIVKGFVYERQKCRDMAQAAYQLRKANVAERIVEICEELSL